MKKIDTKLVSILFGTTAILLLFGFFFSVPVESQPTPDGSLTLDATTSADGSGNTVSWSHTVGSQTNRVLVVATSVFTETETAVTSVTYGAQSLTKLAGIKVLREETGTEMWYLVAPIVGTNTITVTFSDPGSNLAGAATSWYNASQSSNPFSGFSTASGYFTISTDVTGGSNTDIVIDAVTTQDSPFTTLTVGAGQTQRYTNVAGLVATKGSTKAGSASPVTMSWTGGSGKMTLVAGSLAKYFIPPPTPTPYSINSLSGALDSGSNLTEGRYIVEYNSLPAGYRLTKPLNGPPPSYAVTLGPSCSSQTNGNYLCDASGNAYDVYFGITNSRPWIQACGMNIRLDNGLNNLIPSSSTCGSFAINSCSGTTPGIVISGDSSYSFGQGQASANPDNWVVGGTSYPETFTPANPGAVRTSYEYFVTTARQNGITIKDLTTTQCGAGGIANCDLSTSTLANGVWRANGDMLLTSTGTYTLPGSKNFVILVNGNLTIRTRVIVPAGSTATFSASGNITVDQTIGQTAPSCSPATCDLQGYYSADKNFTIAGINNCATGTDRQLCVAGAIVANAALSGGAFQNQRNLCTSNLTHPSVTVVNRLDFVVNAPNFIKHPNFIWQEAAP